MKSAMWRSLAIDASTVCASVGAASIVGRALRVLQSKDLTGFAGHVFGGLASFNLAVCPSAACSPQLGAKVPYAIALWLSVLRRPVHYGAVASHRTWHPAVMAKAITAWRFSSFAANFGGSRPQVLVNRPAYRRSASIRRLARYTGIRQNLCNSSQGGAGVARSNIYQQSKVGLSSAAVPSRPSLTCRSSRHPQVSLVGSLRASRSSAAYLWR